MTIQIFENCQRLFVDFGLAQSSTIIHNYVYMHKIYMYYPLQTFHIKSCIFNFLLMENFLVKCWCDTNQGIEESQTECLEEIKKITCSYHHVK